MSGTSHHNSPTKKSEISWSFYIARSAPKFKSGNEVEEVPFKVDTLALTDRGRSKEMKVSIATDPN